MSWTLQQNTVSVEGRARTPVFTIAHLSEESPPVVPSWLTHDMVPEAFREPKEETDKPSKSKSQSVQQVPVTEPAHPAVILSTLCGRRLLQHPSPPSIELRPTNPRRHPERRWHVAKYIRKTPTRRFWKDPDADIQAAYAFQRKLGRSFKASDLQTMADSPPPLTDQLAAFLLWREDGRRRYEVEARLLAKQPYEEIGEIMLLSPDAISWFHRWFFDFVDTNSYVVNYLVGQDLDVSDGDPPVYPMWKFVAYRGGVDALDVLTQEAPDPAKMEAIAPFFRRMIRQRLAIKSFHEVLSADVNDTATAKQVLRMYQRMLKLQQLEQTEHAQDRTMSHDLDTSFEDSSAVFAETCEQLDRVARDSVAQATLQGNTSGQPASTSSRANCGSGDYLGGDCQL